MIERDYDVVIVGTGMGGSVIGHRLARAGKRVLFLEKGRSHLSEVGSNALKGAYAEAFLKNENHKRRLNVFSKAGRVSEIYQDRTSGAKGGLLPFMGCGTGGSSALYGMVMQRFWPEDFTPKANFPDVPGTDIVEKWPVSYAQLRPYYRKAEAQFGVRGALDPLNIKQLDPLPTRPAPSAGGASEELTRHFKAQGLTPYQPPLACDLVSDCLHCQGFLCPKNCKNDASKICLQPALSRHGAQLLDECEVLSLEADRHRVRKVICKRNGKMFTVTAKTIIMAAGGMATPVILMNSKNSFWPHGLANASGLVGRNMMRNYYDLYFVNPTSQKGLQGGPKDIYLSDFYGREAGKLGILQSFGRLSETTIVEDWENALWANGRAFAVPFLRFMKPVMRKILARKLNQSYVMVSTSEDLPYRENGIADRRADGSISFRYRLGDFEKQRVLALRKTLTDALHPLPHTLLKQAEQNRHFIALACGTCRFGDDPNTSVLNSENRAHGMDNLYVVDASFFPSNPGLNSGLTIAANALRVADRILERAIQNKDHLDASPARDPLIPRNATATTLDYS